MNKNELLKLLKNKLNSKEIVEIFRYGIDDCSLLAVPDSLSEHFLLVHQAGDFVTDGCRILRIDDISEIVTGDKNETLKFTNRIYSSEKLFPKKLSVDISSFNEIIKYFKENNKTVMIECAYDDAIDYYFGKIVSYNEPVIQMKCFDGAGNLFENIMKINSKYVSSITFDDRYSSLMGKYVKGL